MTAKNGNKPWHVDTLELLASALDDNEKRIERLIKEISDLERAGLANASEWWKDQKYLYLVYPTQDGQRLRQYIGSDPEEIAKARAKVERYKRWVELHDVLKHARRNQQSAKSNLDHALWILKSGQRNLWGEK